VLLLDALVLDFPAVVAPCVAPDATAPLEGDGDGFGAAHTAGAEQEAEMHEGGYGGADDVEDPRNWLLVAE
jgi:hypothetical protein